MDMVNKGPEQKSASGSSPVLPLRCVLDKLIMKIEFQSLTCKKRALK